ncbi:MAG: hypothetical protein ACTS4V_01895 [Candidatus Hodgkinia cicadicola]
MVPQTPVGGGDGQWTEESEDDWVYVLTLTSIWIINEVKAAIKRYGPSACFAAKVTRTAAAFWFVRLALRTKFT